MPSVIRPSIKKRFAVTLGQSSEISQNEQTSLPHCEPLRLLELANEWVESPQLLSTQTPLPLYLKLNDYRTGLPPLCYIPEGLGRAILREQIDALFNAAGGKKPAGTLEYWCEEDEGKGLVAPLKLDRGFWIVPGEIMALHPTCIAGHLACLQKVFEREITREEEDEGQIETQLFDVASSR
jgi:hypothetical protein